MHGRYPDYNVLDEADHWDEVTRRLVLERVEQTPPIRFFTKPEADTLGIFCDLVMAQDREPKIPVLNMVDAKLFAGELDGFRYADMPDDRETWRRLARRPRRGGRASTARATSPGAAPDVQMRVVDALAKGELHGEVWDELPPAKTWKVVIARDPQRVLLAPLGLERDRLRRPGLPARLRAPGRRAARELGGRGIASTAIPLRTLGWRGNSRGGRTDEPAPRAAHAAARGALRPPENDSAFLLDVHRRAVPQERMARYDDSFSVDLVIVGAGAGGGTLAQRLARRGWKVVVLESGPFWDPDRGLGLRRGRARTGSTGPTSAITGGTDPVELGKNNSGHGVGGSMVHYAGYCPRFHPSDFEVRTRDGVGEDWPISYDDLKPHYERLELELPVAGEYWPWGDPHRYPHTAHPDRRRRRRGPRGSAQARDRDARRARPASPTAPSATAPTASTAASACRAAR